VLDAARVIETLVRHRVGFVLVGGLAGQVRGATRLTADIDICPRWTMENLGRRAGALAELDARIKIEEGSIETLAAPRNRPRMAEESLRYAAPRSLPRSRGSAQWGRDSCSVFRAEQVSRRWWRDARGQT
jgi:hypothetical protein